jgi:hypothetical protein
MNFINKYYLKLLLIVFVLIGQISFGQKVKAPIDLQIKIIPKILSLEKNLSQSTETNFNISILFSKEQRNSVQVFESFAQDLNKYGIKLKDKEATVLPYDISNKDNLRSFLKNKKIKLLYITPIRGIDISEITRICKEEGVLTFSGVEEYIVDQVSVVLTLEDNKLQIMINQKSSKQAGADFSSRLLRIAKIIDL